MDEVRFIVDNLGGITGGMKVAELAECFGMLCQPHNWGSLLDHAVHFHCELAMPNNVWFEMTQPMGITDRPYFKDQLRIDKDGYVPAPPRNPAWATSSTTTRSTTRWITSRHKCSCPL